MAAAGVTCAVWRLVVVHTPDDHAHLVRVDTLGQVVGMRSVALFVCKLPPHAFLARMYMPVNVVVLPARAAVVMQYSTALWQHPSSAMQTAHLQTIYGARLPSSKTQHTT
jgi:hypothetical protein